MATATGPRCRVPFPHVFSLDPRGYKLTVNIYVYAATH